MNVFKKIQPVLRIANSQAYRIRGDAFKYLLSSHSGEAARLSSAIIPIRTNYTAMLQERDRLGPDKGFVIEELREEDIPEVKEFMKHHFYSREPMCMMLNMTYEEHQTCLDDSLKEWVGKRVSFLAREENTNEVIGCLLATIMTQSKDGCSSRISSKNEHYHIKARHDLKLVEDLKNSVDLYKKYNIDKILQMEIGNVHPDFTGRNITKRMAIISAIRGKEVGCQLITGQATNVISQAICRNVGYVVEYEMDYGSMRVDGRQVFDLGRNSTTTTAQHLSYIL